MMAIIASPKPEVHAWDVMHVMTTGLLVNG